MVSDVIGRDVELAAIDRFLERLDQAPAGLVIAGDVGIGKTTLWRAGTERAASRGCLVLTTRPLEVDASSSFTCLADLLDAIDESEIAALPRPQAVALEVACRRIAPGPGGVDRRAVSAGFVSLLARQAALRPVVLAIDDVQWLDRSSMRVVQHAARRAPGRVGFLVTVRTAGDGATSHDLGASLDTRDLVRLQLRGLSIGALRRILKATVARSFPHRLLQRIDSASGGNPLFAVEIARALPDVLPPTGPLPVPPSVGGLVATRISSLPARSREALLAAACLSAPTRGLVLGAVTGDPGQRQGALDDAEEAGLITADAEIQFGHPLVAATVYASVNAPARRRMHMRLAALVSDPEERARHLALGTPEPDESVARAIAAAAESAASRGAPEAAAELAELATLMTPRENRAAFHQRTIQAAEYWLHGGEARLAREALTRLVATGVAGVLRADALRLLGDIALLDASLPEASALYDEALPFAMGDAGREARIETASAFAAAQQGDFSGTIPHAERGLAAAERDGQPALIAESLAVYTIAHFLAGHGLDDAKAQRALLLEDLQRPVPVQMRPTLIVGLLYLYVGRLEDARRLLYPLRTRIIERGEEPDLAFVVGQLAWVEVMAGRLAEAEELAAEGARSSQEMAARPAEASALAFVSLVAGWRGDRAAADRAMAETEAAAEETGYAIATLWSRWGGAVLALAEGDPARALAALEPLLGMIADESVFEPARAFFLADATEALVELGDLKRGEQLLNLVEANANRLDRSWARLAAARVRILLHVTRGQLKTASAVAERALGEPAIEDFPLERARILLAYGRCCRRARRRRDAAHAFERAEDVFAASGALAWAARAQSERRRVGLESSGAELTPSEERIASLAASGLTNRAVADQLFISPKTVEVSLSRAYAKLGIASRAELGAVMATRHQREGTSRDA